MVGRDITNDEYADYTDRAPYIIASFLCEASEADRLYRLVHGLDPLGESETVYLDLNQDFPLCNCFASAAAYYLASMLVCDESVSLSDKFYDKYCDSISSILASLPAESESIVNKY